MKLRGQRAVAAEAVDRTVATRRHQPGPRVARCPVAGPALGGRRERLLRGVLGDVDVTAEADERRHDVGPLGAEDISDDVGEHGRYRFASGRTSTEPPMRSAGIRAAIAHATSRSGASTR